jgi:hypothetical protein
MRSKLLIKINKVLNDYMFNKYLLIMENVFSFSIKYIIEMRLNLSDFTNKRFLYFSF